MIVANFDFVCTKSIDNENAGVLPLGHLDTVAKSSGAGALSHGNFARAF